MAATMAATRRRRVLGIDPGRDNLALCPVDVTPDDGSFRIRRWTVTRAASDPRGLKRAMDDLDLRSWLEGVEVAAIERQPPKNPSIQRIQHYLEMCCAVYSSADTDAATAAATDVVVLDPKLKLAWALSSPWFPARAVPSWTYRERKKLAVETVRAVLELTDQDDSVRETFERSKKKDDLADAFLLAMAAGARRPPPGR
jgi:hypothetical protein